MGTSYRSILLCWICTGTLATAMLACGGDDDSGGCSGEQDCTNGYFCNNEAAGFKDKIPAKYLNQCHLDETKNCFENECGSKGRCAYDATKQKCIAISQEDCEGSAQCTSHGACTLVEDICSSKGKEFGESCANDSECATGLCLVSDYAPLGWCTQPCETEQQPCGEQDETGKFPAYCIRMPDAFLGTTKQFCAPMCSDVFQCKDLADFWETCNEPEYKGNPLYGVGVGVETCQSPGSHGKGLVDPDTCEGWDIALGTGLEGTVNLCRAFCEYLVICQEVVTSGYNEECCGYGCVLKIAPEGVILNKFDKETKCYVQNFFSWRDTPQVCDKPVSECNGKPADPRPSQ